MSGGALTDHQYDLWKLSEWAHRLETDKDYRNIPLGLMLCDLEECLTIVDKAMSGDVSNECADEAWNEFREKWFQGLGPCKGDLIDIGVYAENIITRINKIKNGGKN